MSRVDSSVLYRTCANFLWCQSRASSRKWPIFFKISDEVYHMAYTALEQVGDTEVLDVFGQENQNHLESYESLQDRGVRKDGSGNARECRCQRIQEQNLPVYG